MPGIIRHSASSTSSNVWHWQSRTITLNGGRARRRLRTSSSTSGRMVGTVTGRGPPDRVGLPVANECEAGDEEVAVERQGLLNTEAAHRDERRGVDVAEGLIVVLLQQSLGSLLPGLGDVDLMHVSIAADPPQVIVCRFGAESSQQQRIRFADDVIGSHEGSARLRDSAQTPCRGGMAAIAGVGNRVPG